MIALVVIAVLVAGAWIAIDTIGRSIATDAVRTRVADALGTDTSAVSVDLGSGSLVPQLIAQTADRVTIAVDGATLSGLSGDLDITATGVPFSADAATDALTATVTLGPDEVAALAQSVDALRDATIELGTGDVTLESWFGGAGLALPVSVTATASADDGAILLTPTAASVGTVDFDIDALRASAFASLVDSVAGPQRICLADSLPQGLHLESVTVAPSGVTVGVSGRDIVLGTLETAPRGSC